MHKTMAVPALLVACVLLAPGCSRMTWDASPTFEVNPAEEPEAEATKAPDPMLAEVAGDFFGAMPDNRMKDAYALLTAEAQKALSYQQFEADLTSLGVASHSIVAQTQTGDAGYVVESVLVAPTGEDAVSRHMAFGLLLRRSDDGWRISFFAPHGEPQDVYADLSLTELADGEFRVTYTDPDETPYALTITELRP